MRVLCTGAVALMLATAAVAQPLAQPHRYNLRNKCVVANKLCFVVRAPAADMPSTKRVDLMNDRLARILGYENLSPANIRVETVNHERAIFVGDQMLIDVTKNDAKANNTSRRALAHEWVARLRAALPQARPVAPAA